MDHSSESSTIQLKHNSNRQVLRHMAKPIEILADPIESDPKMDHQRVDFITKSEAHMHSRNKASGAIAVDSTSTILESCGSGFYSKLGREEVKHVMEAQIADTEKQSVSYS